ncbi:hypothetical protein OH77DRAFT_1515292 [Trametes cingulata]|nr:hypothetical protein OH77DRAFT_1515292 [Trametes cingulata]
MEDGSAVPEAEVEPASSSVPFVPVQAPALAQASAAASVTSRVASPAHVAAGAATLSSPVATTPTIPSLPPKPEVEPDQRPPRRRRSKSPLAGPRHRGQASPTATPPHAAQPVPTLPPKPEWTRRNTAAQPPKTESPAPGAASEAAGLPPPLRTYQPKPSVTAELEAEVARIRAHRTHLETEYLQIAAATRRAMQEYDISTMDLKMAEKRRELADSALEKARLGILGSEYLS